LTDKAPFVLSEIGLEHAHFCRYKTAGFELDSKYLDCMRQAITYFHQQLLEISLLSEEIFIKRYFDIMINAHKKASYKNSKLGEQGELRIAAVSALRPNAIAYAQKVATDFDLSPPMPGRVVINGVPEVDWPLNLRTGEHYYAEPHALNKYFESASRTLFKYIRQMEHGGNLNHARKLIGEYYHTLINARPFGHVNNSLIMGQVNYLLLNTNHSGMLHGDLDHLFTRFDHPDAMRIWVKAIDGKLPIASDYGIDIQANPTK